MNIAFVPTPLLPTRTAKSRATCPRMDSEAPPESRVAPYYTMKGRFNAPYIKMQYLPDCELMSIMGVTREEVPLDLDAAAELLAPLRAQAAKEMNDLDLLFSPVSQDSTADSVVDRCFPPSRRYEVPVIEMEYSDEMQMVSVGVGTIVPEKFEDEVEIEREGEFWKGDKGLDPVGVVERKYGKVIRNKAPVIEFDALRVGLSMQELRGEPEVGAYEGRAMLAPMIKMKKPAGEWDTSGFVEVGCEEVQLPLMEALALR